MERNSNKIIASEAKQPPFKEFLFFLLLLIFTSCSLEQPVDPATLRIGFHADPDILNPILSSDAYSSRVLDLVNDSLIERDPDTLEFIPKIAKKWEISPNHLEYTFYLREDVTWHNREPFTADDVLFSFEKIKDPKVNAPHWRVYYKDVLRVEKIDDYTVKFVYSQPYFLALSSCGGLPLVSKYIFDDRSDFNTHNNNRVPVGTGPYRFVEWKGKTKIVLARNENYWDQKPEIKKIVFRIIPDDTITLQVLKKGELDYAGISPIQWVKQTQSKKFNQQFEKYKYLVPGYSYIGWNKINPLFQDKKVRQAMTHLIDREKLLQKLRFGLGMVVESHFFPGSSQHNPHLKIFTYDVNRAKELLSQAGWADHNHDGYLDKDGQQFKFTLLYPSGNQFFSTMSTILKEDLEKMGIVMNIERMEWAAFLERIDQRKFDAVALGWATGFEGDPYQIWHSSQAEEKNGHNFVSFINQEVDQIIEQARIEFDENKRDKLYWRFQEIINEYQPYTFLMSNDSLVVVSKRFKNVIVHKAGLEPLEWKVEK